MKTLNVNGRIFEYEIEFTPHEFGGYYETIFYEGYKTYTRKKYFLFGDYITISKPKKVFTLYLNIEDEAYTKSEIRVKIKRKIELLNRKEEIENGQII